jgi:alkylated DNA repair dioxygenase AlkB
MSTQLDLFDQVGSNEAQHDYLGVRGLVYLEQLLSVDAQRHIIAEVDALPWQTDLKRRVQHCGYKYDYKARAVDPSMYVGPLPLFAVEVAQQLRQHNLIVDLPDQLIVNEYQPGQGITAHVDCVPCFKDRIVTVSLGSACEMDFMNLTTRETLHAWLKSGSALLLSGEARYDWTHEIKGRKTDRGIRRDRRVSLTFRNVILQE